MCVCTRVRVHTLGRAHAGGCACVCVRACVLCPERGLVDVCVYGFLSR